MPLNKDGRYEPPRWLRWLNYLPRMQFMPRIHVYAWWVLWAIAFATMCVHLGGKWASWWPGSDELSYATAFAFFLLAFTPQEFPAKTVWLISSAQTQGRWIEINAKDAAHIVAIKDTQWHLRKLVLKDGSVQEDVRVHIG